MNSILDNFTIEQNYIYNLLGIKKDKEISLNFDEIIEFYYDKPVEFAEDLLNFSADTEQQEIMRSILDYKRTSVRSGQGIGKTATVACTIIWYLCTRYNAKIIATAPNITQLYTVLWAEIAKWMQDSILTQYLTHTKTRLYVNDYEKTWFAFPKTATTAEGIAGQHADNLLVIADEASGIKDDILETLLGTITGDRNKLLFISNPTRTSGVFFNAFHSNAGSFNTIHVNSENSRHVDKENIEMLAKSYGIDSNVYRVRVKGDFPTQEDDVLISLELVSDGIYSEQEEIDPEEIKLIKIGVDVARFGDDSTVIVPNVNNNLKCEKIKIRHGQDTMATTGDIVLMVKMLHNKYINAKIIAVIDDIGVGGGVVDRLNEIIGNAEIHELNGYFSVYRCIVSQSIKNELYDDLTTFMWGTIKELLEEKQLSLPDSGDLTGQLTTRKYKIVSRGKMKLESKDEMKKRGLKSPDIADAVAMSCLNIGFNNGNRESGKRM